MRGADQAPGPIRGDDRTEPSAGPARDDQQQTPARAARRMWTLFEPVHSVTYFSAEARSAFEEAGLRGFWRGYFAGRSAPLGRVPAAPVTASFFTFAPAMVSRALPAVWDLISPDEALAVRQAGAVAALRRLLPGVDVSTAADLIAAAVTGLNCEGRVLAAANAALALPDEPVARIWQCATLLREHRGDGHFATLVAAGLDGCESLALKAASGISRELVQPLRGWTDEEWEAANDRLAKRGLLTTDGLATPDGTAFSASIEDRTDEAAARPWHDLDLAGELIAALTPIAEACAAEMPYPNPIGMRAGRAGVVRR
jgi:hypothetical protein